MTHQRKFDAVCFDCDSTLSRIEGIDELAARRGLKQEVARLTEAAMEGSLPIEAVYAERLSIVSPDRASVAWLGELYVQELVPGAKRTVESLQRLGKAVYLVSGGLLPAVRHLGRSLAIPDAHHYAVPIHFDGAGAYRGFDTNSVLARADGKAIVCRQLAGRHGAVAMVGDGMTDLSARMGGAYVVGFGGVAYREQVARGADVYLESPDLSAILDLLLNEEERRLLALA